jgi:two-component system sensor histidine kinase UhpB
MVSTAIDHLKGLSGTIQGARAQRSFAELASDTRHMFDAIRRLSHDLHPATLRVLGLAPALKTHCAEIAMRHRVHVTFTAGGDLQHLPSDVAVCCFRIAQESLRNGIDHGAARRLTVSLTRSGDDVEMTITDDGCGFDLETVSRNGDGVGVIGMEERARTIGGTLHIVTGAQRGTTVRLRARLKLGPPVGAPDASVAAVAAPTERSTVAN